MPYSRRGSRRGATTAGALVLIVEDNPLNAKLVRDVLVARGDQVAESTTAERGLEIAREQHPELIPMDIQLPGMDGRQALAARLGHQSGRAPV